MSTHEGGAGNGSDAALHHPGRYQAHVDPTTMQPDMALPLSQREGRTKQSKHKARPQPDTVAEAHVESKVLPHELEPLHTHTQNRTL